MKFFLDTADVGEIETGLEWGMVDGVTTNPSLIAKQGKPYLPTVKEIAELVPGPVSGEVLATDLDGMLEQGRRLAGLAENVVVKVPLGPPGLTAVQRLAEEGNPVQRDPLLLAGSGAACGEGGRGLHFALRRPPRRHRRGRHEPDSAGHHDLLPVPLRDGKCSSLPCGILSTS